MITDQRLHLERSLAAENSKKHQNLTDHEDWINSGFTFRTLCHYDKIFVVWKQGINGPQILGKLRIINVGLDTYDGFEVCIESDIESFAIDGTQWIGHNPTRLFGLPVFAHIPYICEVTFTPDGRCPDKSILRFPVVFKTEGNPAMPKVGKIYVTQIGEFRGLHPEFADLKL